MSPNSISPDTPQSPDISQLSDILQPSVIPNYKRPKVGFNRYAERLNGRLAMLALVIQVLIELTTGQGVLHLFGLT